MSRHKNEPIKLTRRQLLQRLRWSPMLFLPAPLLGKALGTHGPEILAEQNNLSFHDYRLTPHYPVKSPLDDILRLVVPGSDEYTTEKYAFGVEQLSLIHISE